MPILDIPAPDSPLTQGDVLKDVPLYETPTIWSGEGTVPLKTGHKYCMVVSRPCAAKHKTKVLAIAIEKYKPERPSVETYVDIIDALKGIRDGEGTPDCFYLGQIPGAEQARYRAKLDSFFTIGIPASRTEIIRQHRVCRLTEEFARDLHTRIFQAFASLGFDDYAWFSDEDLTWIIRAAEKDLSGLRTAISAKQFEGATSKEIEAANKNLEQRLAEIAPYREEFERRNLMIQ